MITALSVAGACLAWVGGAGLVLSEGRRGLAAGVAAAGLGLGLALAWWPEVAVAVGAAGSLAGALRLRGGLPGWQVMPPGSTPRVILVAVAGLAGVFVAASVLPGPGLPATRVAALLAGSLAAARGLSTQSRSAVLASASSIALALAAIAALVAPGLVATPLAAAAAAGLIAVLPGESPEETAADA